MGKKGTKRKTRWRTLPLGGEDAGSGNEDDLLDEDRSTCSSGHASGNQGAFRNHPVAFRMGEKPYRQTRRFAMDGDRSKTREPLVKLESKTFDEEEYTKITTPRQDVLFKKGYFGKRKPESSLEDSCQYIGDAEGEESMMEQIIITNGFVDERGHYLVNGNSYEIYDPYTNTVTVVVGPPPYTTGVTPPVLAAVSCQPVPLQPVDWYPPGPGEWPHWGPAYQPVKPPDSVSSPGQSCDSDSPPPAPVPFNQPAYIIPGFPQAAVSPFPGPDVSQSEPESPEATAITNGDACARNETTVDNVDNSMSAMLTQPQEAADPNATTRSTSTTVSGPDQQPQAIKLNATAKDFVLNSRAAPEERRAPKLVTAAPVTPPATPPTPAPTASEPVKKSHGTQTTTAPYTNESHIAQRKLEQEHNKKNLRENNTQLISPKKEAPRPVSSKPSPVIPYQKRLNFNEEKDKPPAELKSPEPVQQSPVKISYAKTVKNGLESITCEQDTKPKALGSTTINGTVCPHVTNGQTPLTNGYSNGQQRTTNGVGEEQQKRTRMTNGNSRYNYDKTKNYRSNETKSSTERPRPNISNEFIAKEKKAAASKPVVKSPEKKVKNLEIQNDSEKSSTISELSSPTELSSGQNTPPEKTIVKKMEKKIANEINKSFEERLKQNLKKTEEVEKVKEDTSEASNKTEDKTESPSSPNKSKQKTVESKKKKNKMKVVEEEQQQQQPNKQPRAPKPKKKKKGTTEKEREREPSSNSNHEIPSFLQERPQDPLFDAWPRCNKEDADLMSDLSSILNVGDETILKSLGVKTQPNIKLSQEMMLMLMPSFRPDPAKFKFDSWFKPGGRKLTGDVFTKTNINNIKSTKPEEFFASIVDSPANEFTKGEKRKETKKETSETTENAETVKETTNGAQVKKITQKTGYKISKTDQKSKQPKEKEGEGTKDEVEESKKNDDREETKLGILEAVNTWLQEQGEEKVLSLPQASDQEEEEEEEEGEVDGDEKDQNQKNAQGNPSHALSVEDAAVGTKDDGCRRVAAEKKKIKKFLTECQEWVEDVKNGVSPSNELCDARQSVDKYYTLTKTSESESDGEVCDALEYKFLKRGANLSITDSGVQSETDDSDTNPPITDLHPFPSKQHCKLQ